MTTNAAGRGASESEGDARAPQTREPSPAPDAKRAPVPLTEQIVEVEKTIRDRARRYPDLVARGRLLPDTADRKLEALRGAQTSLTWLDANMYWIRPEAERRIKAQRLAAEADELRSHPAVAPVLEALPGAEISRVTELTTPEPQTEDAA